MTAHTAADGHDVPGQLAKYLIEPLTTSAYSRKKAPQQDVCDGNNTEPPSRAFGQPSIGTHKCRTNERMNGIGPAAEGREQRMSTSGELLVHRTILALMEPSFRNNAKSLGI